jgi:hypothetical protein
MMRGCAIACTATMMLGVAAAKKGLKVNPVSWAHPIEPHHSLSPPMDKNLVYWNFGGATVMTKKLARLTPSTQDRRGWLWNEYPLEKEFWELEVHVELFSKPHFGGDGFGIWILSGDMDPTFSQEPDFLNGPIFGMKKDFKGTGIIFDVYDNDNRRNNPSVFVLQNDGKPANFNHDNDYENDMVKTTPDKVPGHDGVAGANDYKAYQCVADFRNTGKNAKVLVKYLHDVLHVYIDVKDGQGYKFCLALELPNNFLDHHIAFTAATGQLADSHDLKHITTRYLSSSDKEFDDLTLSHFNNYSGPAPWISKKLKRLINFLAGLILTSYAFTQLRLLEQLRKEKLDPIRIAIHINTNLQEHYLGFLGWVVWNLITKQWRIVFLNLPMLGWRALQFGLSPFNRGWRFSEADISGHGSKGHSGSSAPLAVSAKTRLLGDVVVYGVLAFYYFLAWMKAW